MISLFFAFIFTAKCEEEGCTFNVPSSFSESFSNSLSGMRGLFSGFLDTDSNFPDLSNGFDDVLPYIFDILSTALPFLILLVILLLYFCFGQCCCICCCRPQKKHKVKLIPLIIHIFFGVVCVVSIIFFYMSAVEISNIFNEGKEIIPSVSNTFQRITSTIGDTIDGVFNIIDTTVVDTLAVFKGLVKTLQTDTLDKALTAIQSLSDNIDEVQKNTQSITDSAKQFDNDWKHISDACGEQFVIDSLYEQASGINTRLTDIKDSMNELTSSSEDIEGITGQLNTQIENIETTVQEQIDDLKNGDLGHIMDPIEDIGTDIDDVGEPVSDALDTVNTYWKAIMILFITLFLVFIACYMIFYFCTNIFARGCFCLYLTFSWFWTIIFLVPAIIFSVLFFLFYDGCPSIENQLDGFIDDVLPEGVSIKDVLICPEKKPIYTLLGLNEEYDYTKMITDFRSQIDDQINDLDIGSSLEGLDSALNVDIENQFSAEGLQGFSTQEIQRTIQELGNNADKVSQECKAAFDANQQKCINDLQAIDDAFNGISSQVENAKGHALTAQEAAGQLEPQINQSLTDSKTLVVKLSDQVLEVVDGTVNSLDCTLLCTIYSPLKNILCVSLINAMAYWLFSAILVAIGLFCLSITVYLRRKDMLPEDATSESSDDSVEDISYGKSRRDEDFALH